MKNSITYLIPIVSIFNMMTAQAQDLVYPKHSNAFITEQMTVPRTDIDVLSYDLRLKISPENRSISGFPPPLSLAGRVLALPGQYRLKATLEGYRDLQEPLEVVMGGFQEFSFQMEELPRNSAN